MKHRLASSFTLHMIHAPSGRQSSARPLCTGVRGRGILRSSGATWAQRLHLVSAADVERLGRYPAGLLGREENDHICNVLRLSYAPERVLGRDLLLHFGRNPTRL